MPENQQYENREYIAKIKTQKDELNNQVISIAKNFEESPESIKEYLEFQSRFYRYSARNTLLIRSQNKGASLCGSFKFFKDKGYSIKKGEHSMKILVPTKKTFLKLSDNESDLIALSDATKEQKEAYKKGKIEAVKKLYFKVGNVFDISQTTCPKSEYPKFIDIGYSSEQHYQLYQALKRYSEEKLHCPVNEDEYSSISLRGFYSPSENRISISSSFDDTTKLSILSHELGHAVIIGAMTNEVYERYIEQIPSCQSEFEADAVSVMLHHKFGIDITESRQSHLSDAFNKLIKTKNYKPEILTNSLERANNAFRDIAKYLDSELTQTQIPSQLPATQETILPNQIPGFGMVQSM